MTASPAQGCAFWEREPGADDEPDWLPPGQSADPGADHQQAVRRVEEARRLGLPGQPAADWPPEVHEAWLNRGFPRPRR